MTKNHDGIILEDIDGKLSQILEATDTLKDVPKQLKSLNERLANVEDDVKVIKAAVTHSSREQKSHGAQLEDHEQRLQHIEQAA